MLRGQERQDVSAAASLIGKIGAHTRWANCEDRTAATAPGRAAFEQTFFDAAGGDPKRAEQLRRAHYARMALASKKARAARKAAAAEKAT
jgi:hypothetical protein